jgi:MFS family permease
VTSRLALAAVAIGAMFVLNGILIGGYSGVLPAVTVRLGLSAGDVSVFLFVGGVAAIAAMQIGGRVSDAATPRIVVLVGLPLMVAGAALLALASSFAVALVASVLLGLGAGAMDVSMNALAVQLERARLESGSGGSILSFFHALWSTGHLTGAGLAFTVAALFKLSGAAILQPVLLSVAALGAIGWLAQLAAAPRGEAHAAARDPRSEPGSAAAARVPRAAYLLGAIGLASGLAEGTASSWSSLHVTEVAHVDPSVGSLGLVAVSGCMVAVRFLGDRLVDRFGRRAVVRAAGVLAAIGYASVTCTVHLVPLLVGWAAVGAGVGILAPQVYGAAGHLGGGRVLATVVTFGYAGYLAGPAVIGGTIRRLGMAHTMIVPAALCLLVVAFAGTMPDRVPVSPRSPRAAA